MIPLLTVAVVLLASVTAYFTFFGLAALAPQVSTSMIALGLSLEFSKYVGLAYVYRHWKELSRRLKYTLTTVILMVMVLSSTGVFGYLQSSFSASLAQGETAALQLADLSERRAVLQKRLQDIEAEQRRTPDAAVRSRIALVREYESRRREVAAELQTVQQAELAAREQQITVKAHTGPLAYVAQATGVPVAQAVTWLSLLVTLTLDPLAMLLSLCLVHAKARQPPGVDIGRAAAEQRAQLVRSMAERDPPRPPRTSDSSHGGGLHAFTTGPGHTLPEIDPSMVPSEPEPFHDDAMDLADAVGEFRTRYAAEPDLSTPMFAEGRAYIVGKDVDLTSVPFEVPLDAVTPPMGHLSAPVDPVAASLAPELQVSAPLHVSVDEGFTPAPALDPDTEVAVYPMPQQPLDTRAQPVLPDERTPVAVSKRNRLLEKG